MLAWRKAIKMKRKNRYDINHTPIRKLDGIIKSETDWDIKKQIEKENKITNKNKENLKRVFEIANEEEKC